MIAEVAVSLQQLGSAPILPNVVTLSGAPEPPRPSRPPNPGETQGQMLVPSEAKMLPHPFVEGFVPGDGSSYWAGGFSFLTHGLRARNRLFNHQNAQQGSQVSRGVRKGWW